MFDVTLITVPDPPVPFVSASRAPFKVVCCAPAIVPPYCPIPKP